MDITDVDRIIQPLQSESFTQPSFTGKRLTFQNFSNDNSVVNLIAPHNSDVRIADSDKWPPPLIFDIAYGCAALNTWGVPAFNDFARTQTRDIYYNDREDENNDGGDREHQKQVEERDKQATERTKRTAGRKGNSANPDIADMVCALWMLNARKGQHQVHAMEADRNQKKVEGWLESMKPQSMKADRNQKKVEGWLESMKPQENNVIIHK
jgi:hypothetical protein